MNYDILGLARLLVFTRFLNHNSKIKSFEQKELTEKQNFIETLEKYAQVPATIPNSRKRRLDKYIITTQINKETGEILKIKEIREVNLDKLEKENKLMGYYILAISRLEMSDDEMLSTYKGLTKIENCFRILKTNLETRPVYVRTEEHINAHFLICFIALTMMRIL
ncbi:transposase [Fusobacterium nucleatum]|nr:transposase [Fusobacterium polymorphum]